MGAAPHTIVSVFIHLKRIASAEGANLISGAVAYAAVSGPSIGGDVFEFTVWNG